MLLDKAVGTHCPELTLQTNLGDLILPAEFKNSWNLVYFYPKDDTQGCTTQACAYRDNVKDFLDEKINVWGVSADSLESHENFVSKYGLNFALIVDSERKLAETFKVEDRDTFLLNPDGIIIKVWRHVDPDNTAEQTLHDAKALIKALTK